MAGNRIALFSFVWSVFLYSNSFSQPVSNRYIIFFKDKTGTPYSLSQPEQFLSGKAVSRRIKQNVTLVSEDLPVNPDHINSVSATGAKVLFATKWMNGVLAEATSTQLVNISNLPAVDRVEYVAKEKTGYTGGRLRSTKKFESIETSQVSMTQNSLLALDEMHNDGITGSGVTIAVLDTGFPGVLTNAAFAEIISSGRILDSYNFGTVAGNAFVGHSHGAQVFSVIAALTSAYKGGAFDADFLLYATEFTETEYRIEEYNWLCAAERADSAGADIITTSLGYTDFDDPTMDYKYSDLTGNTAVITKAVNMAIDRGIVVVSSAGNYGNDSWTYVSPPADAENILAVGSVNIDLSHSSFSSYGPTADGRIKPDVVALGGPAATILPNGSVKYEAGTSVSCPQITSLVAGVMQKWPELKANQIVQLIRESGSRSFKPDTTFGYGIPSYRAVKNILERPAVLNNDILIYPNPVDNVLNVALSTIDGSPTRLQIFSILGQPLLEINYESIWHLNPISLDLSSYLPGQYVVRVENKNSHGAFRIIKR